MYSNNSTKHHEWENLGFFVDVLVVRTIVQSWIEGVKNIIYI